jgi:hypothetical protein
LPFRASLWLIKNFNGIFAVYIAGTTPDCRCRYNISSRWLAYTAQEYRSEDIGRLPYCMMVRADEISAVISGAAVVMPIRPTWRTVLYLLMVVG